MADAQNILGLPLRELRGVGIERATQLARLELHTVEDLLLHPPRRYEERRNLKKISEVQMGVNTLVYGKIVACGLKKWRYGTKSVFEMILEDGSGRLHCRWWNQPFRENQFETGNEVLVFGKVLSLKPRTIDHPETEIIEGGEESFIHLNRIAPIYPLTEGLPQRWIRALLWRILELTEGQMGEPHPTIPFTGMPTRANAVRMIHFPEELHDIEVARQRLAMDEFVEMQLAMQARRKKMESKARALPCGGTNVLIKKFLAGIGFTLTGAQTKVLREIRKDMSSAVPMRRLLQGDVGAGKTAVAACSALMALESGFNVALMSPTEILAEQHFQNFRKWFAPLGISVELLTGSVKSITDFRTKQKDLLKTANSIFVGTHALIESSFTPEKLGLVIIDEQHKFGVAQRERFVKKGNYPHLLVMTATPIPRTLGLTLYGDLDISVIDELPGGRGKIKTFVRTADKLAKVWDFIRSQLKAGRQAYVVYPRVEDTENGETKAVKAEFTTLQKLLAPMRVGLLHGRLKGEEKEAVMSAFRQNTIQVLLATTVIEVGVDIPNATIMLIENAEQFGLAQLHQLRGRIGRGAHESYCILIATAKTAESQRRLKILETTTDGFRIAEEDLKLRGPGELLGTQQSGMPPLRFGDLVSDLRLVERARDLVKESLNPK
ncbi:MAG: ATP-dependent helicase RecG [Verrucomicrobiales bacterium]|nr:ATP-dependent helicase RecG [Verrucomicrobiales bacterium]